MWIATEFREEHRQAIDYLNKLVDVARFFAVEVGVVRIDDSRPAPIFRLVAAPNDWHAVTAAEVRSVQRTGEREQQYLAYWAKLLDAARSEGLAWAAHRKPARTSWFSVPADLSGAHYTLCFSTGGRMRVELYVDGGTGAENLETFNALRQRRETIESVFGEALSWEKLENRRACRVASYTTGDVANTDEHYTYVRWMLDRLADLRRSLAADHL